MDRACPEIVALCICLHAFENPGALSHDNEDVVKATAQKVLAMYQRGGPGIMKHMQTRRFLQEDFEGLGSDDPPLRPYVLRLAQGERLADMEDAAPFKKWISSFRLYFFLPVTFFRSLEGNFH